jgi:glycosyltransferase involved in cell wall biosynthesis
LRIAYFSPLRPQPTGIADYSEEILPHLALHHDIDLYVDGYEPSNPVIRDQFPVYDVGEFEERNRRHPYDTPLYQMGNNVSHLYAYRMLQRYPGVVVLHDAVLHHFLGAAFLGAEKDRAAYYDAFSSDLGDGLLRRRTAGLWSEVDHFVFRGIRRAVEGSRAVIVHSPTTKAHVLQAVPQARVHVVPHHIGPDCSPFPGMASAQVKEHYGLPLDTLLVGTFGFITESKRFRQVLCAFRELLRAYPRARYLVVGSDSPFVGLREMVREMRLEGLVWITGYVPWEDFYGLMDATDICIQLRYPSAGEMSGAILRVMSKGKPVILSNYEQFGEFPDDCCLKVDLGPAEVPMIARYLDLLAEDPQLRQRIGENARSFVNAHNSMERTIQGYLEVLDEVDRENHALAAARGEPMDKKESDWVDVPALMAAIRRELARQMETGQQGAPDWERFEAVDTEWLMEDIRIALAERWHAGQLVGPDMGQYQVFDSVPEELEKNLKLLNEHWNKVYEPLSVQSRTPFLGKVWANLRQRIHEEVRSYLDPMIWRQGDLNAAMVNSLNMLTRGFYGGSLAGSLQSLYQEIRELRRQVEELQYALQQKEQADRGAS